MTTNVLEVPFKIPHEKLVFNSEANQKSTSDCLLIASLEAFKLVYKQVLQNAEPFKAYGIQKSIFNKPIGSLAGLYLLVHTKSGQFYIGSSVNLGQRRREIRAAFQTPYIAKKRKSGNGETLIPAFNKKVLEFIKQNPDAIKDFYFIPLIFFDKQNLSLEGKALSSYLDLNVESRLITHVFNTDPLNKKIFNVKAVGAFQENNTFGGSPESGSEDCPVALQNPENPLDILCAFESISAAANMLGVSPRAIRYYRDKGIMVNINKDEFDCYPVDSKFNNAESLALRKANDEGVPFSEKQKELRLLVGKLKKLPI